MSAPIFRLLGTTFRRFDKDQCFRHSIVISYFTLLCAVPLIALFAFVTTKVLGNSEIALRSLNIFTEDFFARFDPVFFKKLGEASRNISNLGWFGLIGSAVAGSFLFSNLIAAINHVFKSAHKKSFFYNRLMEYAIMFLMAVILVVSLSITAVWTALHKAIESTTIVQEYLNPDVLPFLNNVLVQYLVPFTLGFLVLFTIYKFIPETKVHTRAAFLAAVAGSVLWEIFKRIFIVYIVHFSAIGIVLTKLVQGTLTSIIFFLVWITFSLAILLWGAELACALNERIEEKRREARAPAPAP
jgi:YihY family inner membrane protein